MSASHRPIRETTGAAGLLLAALVAVGCPPPEEPEDEESTDVAEGIFGGMGEPMALADEEQRELFERGREIALQRFSDEDGVGPSFNTTRCVSCHEQPAFGGSSPRYRNFFLLGDSSSSGFELISEPGPEPREDRPRESIEAPSPASVKSGVQLRYRSSEPYRNPTPDRADVVAQRNAIPFFGVGAIAMIPEEEILKRADPRDRDDDGISGRANSVGPATIGRFGRKAQTDSLEGFVRGPMFNHVGITSEPLTPEMRDRLPLSGEEGDNASRSDGLRRRSQHQVASPDEPLEDSDDVEDPELSRQQLFELISFARLLAAPKPDERGEEAERGRELFESVGCADCHTPTLESPRGDIPLYSDLLLHDMGPELADGIVQADASGSEFRTQPLWGVAATEPYLHDGRADTLDQAIRMHGGEAQKSRDDYVDLSEGEREAVVAFLRSLGGADRDSAGRIPPDDPVPEPGSFEGPVEGLSEGEIETFSKGRRLFDRDIPMSEGLGPQFNGDSCRACHFEPTTAGGGPPGVNVTRGGHMKADGTFEAPPGGTLLHRFDADFELRPSAHDNSNVFELRQPPPLYGLGKIDDIPDEHIERRADPMDMDDDGISGRVARLADGSVGVFGWKALFPSLEDFVRDALTNEMGMTVPDRPGVSAGERTDSDGADDPEFAGERYDALQFYVDKLSPPPVPENPDGNVELGEQVYSEVGCADCHVPEMETADGETVRLHSDLLLHEVMPEDYRGVAGGAAGPREFRTPPLWGVSASGPYMHDGLSWTLDGAIRRHAGEASDASDAYEALSEERREALLAYLESI